MEEHAPIESAVPRAGATGLEPPVAIPFETPSAQGAGEESGQELQESDRSRSPTTGWPPWTAALALVGGLVLAAVAGVLVDLVALVLGVKLTSSHTPPGLTIADTVVQDVAFVAAAVYCAQIGTRKVRSWQFGLRRPGAGWRLASGLVLFLLILFVFFSVIWSLVFHPETEKLLEQLGSNEGTALLLLSAALTCVVAPICEELLFRGYIFTALRNWRGTLTAAVLTGIIFGGIHAFSAPALDLVPLAGLGFGLCLLYRYTGSLYPCIVAHLLNNTVAFSSLENWSLLSWRTFLLIAASLAGVGSLGALFRRIGVIAPSPPLAPSGA